ncbi:hypothetical protein PCANC_26008 [Puccinia coronata f. sp. avenae]|uniref:ATP-dependent DNA helicase n=1 Tax=Puccinia coronata f. sp. avenae TaxID=200324 RepID=A0A2N5TYK9_9BASI|nr:hypothetical protein PCANC_26008 [Puccinia coronata f. sp. avenae]
MVTLDPRDRPSTPEEVNLLVLAEIPDKEQEPELYASTTEQMLHGPCKGRAFWREGGCNIGFPKPFTPRTVIIDGAYPAYKRRDNGRTVTKGASQFHNGHVVPYNRFLSLMFNCHLNVEIPVNSTAIKYLYKYITKGHDRAYMSVDIADKTEVFVDGRYISPPEAVTQLAIHKDGEQLVYFNSNKNAADQVKSGKATQTTLTGFMKLNQKDAVGANGQRARTLKYEDIVTYFWWDKSKKVWFPRDQKVNAEGFRSFKELRMVDGVKAKTYQIACNWLGLLVDNYLYNKALVEASAAQTGYQLAEIFAIMCFHSPPADAKRLFETHYLAFTDNVARLDVMDRNSRLLRNSERRVLGLFQVEGIMAQMEHTLDKCGIFITLLLKGGQTSHSAFKIPIDVGKEVDCGVDDDSLLASILAAAELIIWDEVVKFPMNCINAVERTLQRVAQCNKPFGGKVVIFSGDFRQTLPVVKYNKFPPLYLATLRSSKLWKCVEEFQLTENMRLAEALNGPSNHENEAFAKTLLQLGKGRRQRNDFAMIKLKGIDVILCGTTREMNSRLSYFECGGLQGVNMNDNKELND